MLHHTTDPGQRAKAIADHTEREHRFQLMVHEREVYDWSDTWCATYDHALLELAGQEESDG